MSVPEEEADFVSVARRAAKKAKAGQGVQSLGLEAERKALNVALAKKCEFSPIPKSNLL